MDKTFNPYFSIITPIYNVSRFIKNGIDCILSQTFSNYELILVDDGSTDNSGYICDEIGDMYDNVICIHQVNQGSGPARNNGIYNARGRYIVFFDIDDKIENSLLQTCYNELLKNNSPDVLMFSYDSYDEKLKTLNPVVFEKIVCRSNEDIKKNYVDHLLGINKPNGFVWNKVYKRNFLIKNNLIFPKLLIQQDEVFNLHVYSKAENLVILPIILYHYNVYNTGNTRSRYIPNRLSLYNTVKKEFLKLYQFWELEDKRMLIFVYRRFFNSIIVTLNFNNTHKESMMSSRERKRDLEMVLVCDETINCLDHLEKLDAVPKKLFPKLYFKALKRQNCTYFKMIRFSEKIIRSLKWTFKKLQI